MDVVGVVQNNNTNLCHGSKFHKSTFSDKLGAAFYIIDDTPVLALA